jgi:PAS domain-containing protein
MNRAHPFLKSAPGHRSVRDESQRSPGYYADLLDNLQDAVIVTDEQFVVTAWNKAAERMFGWDAEQLAISPRTQRNHVARILTKLQVHSQPQAVVLALRHDAVELRES